MIGWDGTGLGLMKEHAIEICPTTCLPNIEVVL